MKRLVLHLLGESATIEELLVGGDDGLIGKKNNHSVRGTTEVVGPETLPESEETLALDGLDESVAEALVGVVALGVGSHLHESGLHHIEGEGGESTAEARNGGADEVEEDAGVHVAAAELLGLIVGGHHTDVHGHGTADHGETTSPEGEDALIEADTVKSVEDVLVASLELLGLETIGLHSDHGDIEGVADHTGNSTGGNTRDEALVEGNGAAVSLLQVVREDTVEAETAGSVDGLSHEGGGKTGVELHEALLGDKVLSEVEGGGVGTLSENLDTGLDEIDGLDLRTESDSVQGLEEEGKYAEGGETGRETTSEEGLSGSPSLLRGYGEGG